jgi:hypothetical protein
MSPLLLIRVTWEHVGLSMLGAALAEVPNQLWVMLGTTQAAPVFPDREWACTGTPQAGRLLR